MNPSFAPAHPPIRVPAADRPALTLDRVRHAVRSVDGTRASASMLLAAIVAALLVVANQVIDTWTEGHLLAAWIVLWTVAFAALALFAAPARSAAAALRVNYRAWHARRLRERQDEQFWQAALQDARIMADISRAMSSAALDTKAYY